MTEQSGPKQLVEYAVAAEKAGFDCEVSSDHFSPWRTSQTHAPYAWSVLGAVAQATSRVELATYKSAAIALAHDQFRWFAGGWRMNADLPTPHGFEAAAKFVRPEDVAEQIACGPDLDELAEAVNRYETAGFTDVALVHVGDANQAQFLAEVAEPLLAKLRA